MSERTDDTWSWIAEATADGAVAEGGDGTIGAHPFGSGEKCRGAGG